MTDAGSPHARAIGEKLRQARKGRRMSLRELATRAEISASMLSQIETGKAYPSVRSIYGIAAALGVRVDYFFPEAQPDLRSNPINVAVPTPEAMTASELREARVNPDSPDVEIGFSAQSEDGLPVVNAQARPTIELRGGVTWSRLTAKAEAGAEFLEIHYAPGATSGANMSHHSGREFGLVLEGELVVELGFETYTLKVGDSIVFESTTPHRLNNRGPETTRALWVVLDRP